MKLSDLTPGDVAVFVHADGSEGEPFVVTHIEDGRFTFIEGPKEPRFGGWYRGTKVRRLGRGRLVPARIEMDPPPTCQRCGGFRVIREQSEIGQHYNQWPCPMCATPEVAK